MVVWRTASGGDNVVGVALASFWGKTKQAGGVTEVVDTLSSCELEFLGC